MDVTDKDTSLNFLNQDPHKDILHSSSDINDMKEQPHFPKVPPKGLVDWLVRVNRRKAGNNQQNHQQLGEKGAAPEINI